jgi:glycine cleavage system H protein
MNIPANLKYSKDHEWVLVEGDIATIGITDFAQGQLGDIVFVDIQTEGETLGEGDVFGAIEAVNTDLEGTPESVNKDPYGKGWMIKVKLTNPAEVEALMDAAAYAAIL